MTLENLLNILCKKGWKPFGWDDKLSSLHKEYGVGKWYIRFHNGMDSELFDLRQLTSKESKLWQFCMDKGFTPNVSCYRWEKWFYDIDDLTQCEADVSGFDNYGYRLIESALKDESELEEFLLDNIKVGNEQL